MKEKTDWTVSFNDYGDGLYFHPPTPRRGKRSVGIEGEFDVFTFESGHGSPNVKHARSFDSHYAARQHARELIEQIESGELSKDTHEKVNA